MCRRYATYFWHRRSAADIPTLDEGLLNASLVDHAPLTIRDGRDLPLFIIVPLAQFAEELQIKSALNTRSTSHRSRVGTELMHGSRHLVDSERNARSQFL